MLGPSLIFWQSKKLTITSRSSAEVEYRALATTSEVIWVHSLLRDLQVSITQHTTIFCDNKAAIDIVANPVYHAKTKYIELDCNFVREAGFISPAKIASQHQLADILTKALGKVPHWYLGLQNPCAPPTCGGVINLLLSQH